MVHNIMENKMELPQAEFQGFTIPCSRELPEADFAGFAIPGAQEMESIALPGEPSSIPCSRSFDSTQWSSTQGRNRWMVDAGVPLPPRNSVSFDLEQMAEQGFGPKSLPDFFATPAYRSRDFQSSLAPIPESDQEKEEDQGGIPLSSSMPSLPVTPNRPMTLSERFATPRYRGHDMRLSLSTIPEDSFGEGKHGENP